MRRYSLLLLLLLAITSCSRKDCVNGTIKIYFQNFEAADMALLEITSHERGSAFQKPDRIFYSGTSVQNTSGDSMALPVLLDLNHDYQVRFISSGLAYQVHELFFLQQHMKEQWGKKPMDCLNELAYTINSKKLKRPMKTTKSGGDASVYIAINKNEPY